MSKWVVRHCCDAARADLGDAAPARRYRADDPILELFDAVHRSAALPGEHDASSLPPADASTAAHEAAHAVLGIIFGWPVGDVTVGPQPCAIVREPDGADGVQVAALLLGGDIAARYVGRWIHRPGDEHWQAFICRVRSGRAGSCDTCGAIKRVLRLAPSASDAEIIAAIREGEALAIRLVTDTATWHAIREVADELMHRVTMSGDEVREIVARHVDLKEPGEPSHDSAR